MGYADDTTFTVEYAYLVFVQWTERRGDKLVFLCRSDKYDSRTGALLKRGEPLETSALQPDEWPPN